MDLVLGAAICPGTARRQVLILAWLGAWNPPFEWWHSGRAGPFDLLAFGPGGMCDD